MMRSHIFDQLLDSTLQEKYHFGMELEVLKKCFMMKNLENLKKNTKIFVSHCFVDPLPEDGLDGCYRFCVRLT